MDGNDAGENVASDFVRSWDETEELFRLFAIPGTDQILQFIAELRRAGYDQKFRAGQSLFHLVLSRSRRHGLRRDQPCLVFGIHHGIMDVIEGNEPRILHTSACLSAPVLVLLNRLAEHPID